MIKSDKVMDIIDINKKKLKIAALEDYIEIIEDAPKKDFNNSMGQESLTRFDQPRKKKKPFIKNKPNQNA